MTRRATVMKVERAMAGTSSRTGSQERWKRPMVGLDGKRGLKMPSKILW